MLQLLFVLLVTSQVALARENCFCLSVPSCTCTESTDVDFPTCATCTDCETAFASCTNIVNAGNIATLGQSGGPTVDLDQNTACLIVDGVTINQKITGGGDHCIRIQNGATVNGDIEAKWGTDCIEVLSGSTVNGLVSGDSQVNCLRVRDSYVERTELGTTTDCIVAVDSTFGTTSTSVAINGKSGNDCLIISNTVVNGDMTGSSGDDCVEATGSSVINGDFKGESNEDVMYLKDSTVNGGVLASDGDDVVAVLGSTVTGNVEGSNGDDEITVTQSNVSGSVTGLNGNDEMVVCSNTAVGSVDSGFGTDVCASDVTTSGCEKDLTCYTFEDKP
mmetsp:Transcript_7985/g.8811  ORF Transcript_7985/g.8811 Transcript_7985/m.8811 type:complete len:333 (-) Transcript_7985:83-1081(-)|eukprot:CAMPEP_0168524858 /NCGR_PEP_ID=MMETSP0405-20121227/10931_1 /TAXON_ID=498012 /ORGANISM="Trichosphaerium sp, Strain Am-I-7 wt" /LENGTH=332 /DNA_ID=CAMNT_0008547207 /DNA_START=79 /DNA_END=1077 /DNA_ORIENTATION=-